MGPADRQVTWDCGGVTSWSLEPAVGFVRCAQDLVRTNDSTMSEESANRLGSSEWLFRARSLMLGLRVRLRNARLRVRCFEHVFYT